eukprot:scaffold2635_cov71-Phaeocystis_antarctica.AAC.2
MTGRKTLTGMCMPVGLVSVFHSHTCPEHHILYERRVCPRGLDVGCVTPHRKFGATASSWPLREDKHSHAAAGAGRDDARTRAEAHLRHRVLRAQHQGADLSQRDLALPHALPDAARHGHTARAQAVARAAVPVRRRQRRAVPAARGAGGRRRSAGPRGEAPLHPGALEPRAQPRGRRGGARRWRRVLPPDQRRHQLHVCGMDHCVGARAPPARAAERRRGRTKGLRRLRNLLLLIHPVNSW